VRTLGKPLSRPLNKMRSVRLRSGLPPVTQIGDVVKELRRGILKSWGQLKSARPTICAEFARFDHFLRRPQAIEILAEGVGLKLPAPYPAESVNGNIPEEYGTLRYSTMDDVVAILSRPPYGVGSILVKRDLEDAFRHIPVSPLDWPLLD
jgi:hypothetical protein